MQSTFKNKRKKILKWILENATICYADFFKKKRQPWKVNKTKLLRYPKDSFGYYYGSFLKKNNLEILQNSERHDAYHVITGYGCKVTDEVALQYVCFGNGKRSAKLFGVIIIGTILLPEYWKLYRKSYIIGKNATLFYNWNFEKILTKKLFDIQTIIFTKKQRNKLNII